MAGSSSAQDLQSILATLASFIPPAQSTCSAPNGDANTWFVPSDANSAPTDQSRPAGATDLAVEKADDRHIRPQSRSAASTKPIIDPATITTWQDGLRCVTKIAAENAQLAANIRRMMEVQRKSELRWYAERQALKQAQASRASSAAQARSILQSLSNGVGISSPEESIDPEAELANLDRKIYTAQREMEVAMTAELKGLGVRFFGTDRSLVVPDVDQRSSERALSDRPKWSLIVTEIQLLELRRRMVQHLEDLYCD